MKRYRTAAIIAVIFCLAVLIAPEAICNEPAQIKPLPAWVFKVLEVIRNSFTSGFENTFKYGGLGMFVAAMILLLFRDKTTIADRLSRAAIISFCIGSLIPAAVVTLVSALKNFGLEVAFYYVLALEGYLLIPIGIAFYFLPTIVTYKRGKSGLEKSLLFNCFFGWIGPAWTAMLVLSFLDDKNPATR